MRDFDFGAGRSGVRGGLSLARRRASDERMVAGVNRNGSADRDDASSCRGLFQFHSAFSMPDLNRSSISAGSFESSSKSVAELMLMTPAAMVAP